MIRYLNDINTLISFGYSPPLPCKNLNPRSLSLSRCCVFRLSLSPPPPFPPGAASLSLSLPPPFPPDAASLELSSSLYNIRLSLLYRAKPYVSSASLPVFPEPQPPLLRLVTLRLVRSVIFSGSVLAGITIR